MIRISHDRAVRSVPRLSVPRLSVLLFPVLVLTGCGRGYDPAEATAIPESARDAMRDAVANGYRGGVVVGLVNDAGVHTFAVGTGQDRAAWPGPETIFAVGSITKVFTALLLADAVERGELALDDPVNAHLPEPPVVPVRDGAPLTLQHLATHTSGLPKDPGWDWRDAGAATRVVTTARSYDYPGGYGSRYEYSNVGMALLGQALEERTGMALPELLEARVARPLGLVDTGYEVGPADRPRIAPPHRGTEPLPLESLDAPVAAWAAGGVYSTADDLLRFLRAALDADSARLGGALALMSQRYAATDEDGLFMGLGWKIHENGDRRIVHHGGESAGHQAFLGYDPAAGVGVVLLADSRSRDDLDRVALHLLDPRIPLPDFSLPPETSVASDVLASYAGIYAAEGDNSIEIGARDGRLLYTERTPAGDLVRETTVPASSDTKFFFLEIPATLEFLPGESDGSGPVLVLRIQGDVVLRVPRVD